uniref:helicase SRCAP-like isoform X3 n=1 Tax=Oncorhynchus gorbuscha TaxID=8017 RepID=UPI001EAEA77A|nr:helicase SRCAP-like isoform X3 [Oncorhynchus gorbuscha]
MSDSGAEVVQGGLGPSHPKDPSVSTESHSDRFSDKQTEGTEQDLHYGSQTDNRSHTDRQTCAAGPGQDQALQQGGAGGMVVVSGTGHRQPLPGTEKLEYKQETGMEELSREHPARNLSSESFSTASPLPLSPNKDKVPDHKEDRGMEQPQTTLPTQATQVSHRPLSEVKEQAGILQKSEQPITDNCERKQTDISTEPKITMQNSNDDKGEVPGANAVEQGPQEPEIPTEPSESGHVTLGSSHTQMLLPAPPTDVSGTPQPGAKYSGLVPYTPPGSGNSTPSYSTDRQSESDNEKSPPQPKEQIEANGAEEETEMAEPSANLTIQSQSSFLHETSRTAATPHVHHLLSLELDSMQTEQSVEVQMSNPEHVTRMETPLVAAHVLSTDTQGAVMLGGETSLELSEEVQVNQCILPEEHDVIELNSELSSGETKLFIEGTHSDIEMSQLAAGEFEIYSFAEEEIATEVVGERLSLSPSYEVNLFNPLIEHSENCTASEGQDIHLPSPPQTGNDNDQAIIQQGPLSSDHGLSEMEVCSNDFIPSLSTQDVEMTDERYHLEKENTTTEVDAAVVEDSSEVDLVITVPGSDTTVGQADTCTQATAPCMDTSTAVSDHRGVSVSPTTHLSDTQKLPGETEVGSTTSKSSLVSPMEELTEVVVQSTSQHSIEVISSPITESKGQNCPLKVVPGVTLQSTTKPESCVSSHEGPENPQPCPTLTETPVHTQQDVDGAVNVTSTTEVKLEASRSALSSGIIDPKLLLLNRGDTPLLKHPPSLLLGLCVQQSNSLTLPSARSPSSGSDTAPVVECPPKAVAAAVSVQEPVALCIHRGQTEPSVKREPTAALPSTNTPSQPRLLPPSGPTPCTSDRGALTSIKTSMGKAVTVSQTLNPPTIGNTPSKHLSDPKLPSTSGNVMRSSLSSSSCDGSQSGPLPVIRPRLAGVKGPGISSAKEESSDGEADLAVEAKPGRRSMVTHSPAETKVRQWIADRVTPSSSPFSPCSSPPSPSPSSSSDWTPSTTPLALRGPRGRFLSPPSMGLGGSSPSDPVTPHRPRMERHADMAELAKHEAEIEGRTLALKREGFWSIKRLTRLTEPLRPKVHWDYLCEEMQWLSADFAQERRWKRGVARKVVRMVMRHHEELRQKEEKAKRDEHAKIRRVASNVAKEVRAFWGSVEKVVQYKQQSRLEEKRKKALDLQLDFIVGQTEKYSDLLSQALETAPAGNSETAPSPPKKSLPPAVDEDDRDFEPPCGEEEDDEETIDVEEAQDGNDAETQRREMELLRQEGTMSLAELLSTLKRPHSQASEEECSDNSSTTVGEDEEFTANEEDAEDEEDTIAAQEVVEGEADHAGELDDLAKEGDMTVEELLEKYKGAYASDFEEPSASASPASTEESENSGDEEEESEEEESDVESNTTSSDDEDSEEDEVSDIEEEDSEEDECGEGMEILLKEGDHSPPLPSGPRPKKEISHIAATAESLQPKGYTLATTKVKTPIPFLLVGQLREYQHIGLDWLVTMYEKKLNGILADEMGLGKTIQTIALLAHLACEKSNWGPHLIIVPTSVMLNWEMELKRWCPGFKILTYYGSQKERKLKRQGWTKPNAFHVCITSYKLVLQDHQAFRRKSWRYLILDEAQNIKNFKSQRWQSLLNFNSQRRLLLTGTPLQNSLMELWSLMHFLMPHVFQSHREFKEWFSNPLTGMIEGSQEYNEGLVKRLHKVLRPFLLRRIKVDVEKQMPKKYEHVVRCRLSKRQRFLYDDFMAQASTRETLASGHFMSVINILMQLRKVCNHPNLFDPRPIHSPFITKPIVFHTASLVQRAMDVSPFKRCDLSMFDLVGLEANVSRYQADVFLPSRKVTRQLIQEVMESPDPPPRPKPVRMKVNRMFQPLPKADGRTVLVVNKPRPTCPVTPAAQASRTPLIQDVTPTPTPPVQQTVCSVAPTAPPRPPLHPSGPSVMRSGSPMPVLAVRPPTTSCNPATHLTPPPSNVLTQRVLLSPDMQARLPSGEVVSIAQLASLAGRPVSSCQGSKPVTFQLQGNKLTLSGTQLHQVPMAPPRPVQGNVMHLVTSGGQHHLISQPAQVAVFSSANTHAVPTSPVPSGIQLPCNSSQVPSSVVTSSGIVKIVVRQSSKEGGGVPTLAVPPSPRVAPQASTSMHHHANTAVRTPAPQQTAHRHPGPTTAQYTLAPLEPLPQSQLEPVPQPPSNPCPPRNPTSALSQSQPPRPVLKVVTGPAETSTEQKARVNSTLTCEESSDTKSAVPKSGSHVGGFVPPRPRAQPRPPPRSPFYMSWLADSLKKQRDSRLAQIIRINDLHCSAKPVFGHEVLDFLTFLPGSCPAPAPRALGQWGRSGHAACLFAQSHSTTDYWDQSCALREGIHTTEDRLQLLKDVIERFTFVIPPVEAPAITMHSCHPPPSLSHQQAVFTSLLSSQVAPLARSLHRIQCNMRTHFPDLRLIQYDCGKLQTLHTLLRRLKEGQHRVLIFTQMTRMLDVLEQFLNYHGHIYLRLDGSTRVEQRQSLMDRFNADRRIFCFILSTRSGGVGVNLTGADTVVFYDSDWNPTMDAQAQDRCHRIGQTRDVHIYRLISERTVEENILKKANQKRMLGDMAIEGGNFTTAFFKQQTIRELFDVNEGEKKEVTPEPSVPQPEEEETGNKQSTTILEQALCRAEDEEDIVAASQAKAEQVAELAEFNEAIPLDEAGEGRDPEEEELSKAEQEIAALVEQLTPIERYAMNFLEASLEDVCKEELKQAEEQVEAARKGLDQAKEEGLKLHAGSSDNDDEDFASQPAEEPSPPGSGRRPRRHKEKGAPSTRISGRLRGATASPPPTSPEPESDSPTPREVPERLRSALRGRGGTKDNTTTPSRTEHPRAQPSSSKESAKPASTTPASPSRDSSLKSGSAAPPLGSQSHSSSVPSTATSPLAGKSLTLPGDSHTWSPSRERAVCITSESTCPVDHQSYSAQARDYDIRDQESLSPSSVCPLSRSPRKRQSADGEVLLGLPEHSPSAKVLRKLPGRLVTVVEDKEPRKRRRRGSGTGGGSSEETENAESGRVSDEPSRDSQTPDKTSQTPEEKGTASKYSTTTKLTEDQESHSTHTYPARSYLPYSPPHQSPDMPVLRNLPVRQRLESESRVAAQLGELGRGRGGNYHRKMDNQPGKDGNVSSPANNANSTPPVKRKRGRPPKTPLRLAVSQPEHVSPPQPTSASEGSPALSPKRKRGRPRKDSTTVKNAMGAGHNSNSSTTSQPGSLSEAVNTEPLLPSAPTEPQTVAASAICTSQDSLSTKAEDSTATLKPNTKTEVLTTTPTAILALSPAQILTTTAIPAPSRTRVPISIPISVSTSSSATISTSVPILVPATSSPTVPALNSISVPASSSSTVSTLSLPTVSTSRPPFSPTSRSTSGLIQIPTAVLTSTLAQFLTSRPRVSTSPPISTTTTQIVTPTPNKISTPPLAQITIPTPAQISKMATSVSTPTITPTPAPTPTLTNVKQTPTPCPTTIVATHVPTLRKLTTTSIANLTTISTPGPSIIVTTVTQARTATITATTSIPTSTKITITTPTPAPTPTTTLTSTPAPTTTVTTVTPAPTTTVTTVTPAPTTTVTTVTPAPTTTVTTVTPAPTTTVTTVTPAPTTTVTTVTPAPTTTVTTVTPAPTTTVTTVTPAPTTTVTTVTPAPTTSVTTAILPPPRTVTTSTQPPPRTVTTSTQPPPRTVTTASQPPPRTVTTATPPPPRTVTTSTPPPPRTVTTSTPPPPRTVTTSTPPTPRTVTTSTPPTPRTVTTSTPPTPRNATTSTPPTPRTATTSTPPPPRTATTSTPPPPRTVITSTPPPPRTVTTATVAAATTITSTPTPISTPTPTRSQVHNSTTTKIVTQISTPAPTPSSTLVLPLAQIPITSTLSSNSTAVAATENQAVEPAQNPAQNPDSENIIDMEVETQAVKVEKKAEDGKEEISDSQPKKRKVENSPEAKDTVLSTPSLADPETPVAPRPEETDKQKIEESAGDDKAASKKRPLSRQSSQESVRSSSPSSVCSTSNPTRSAQYKKSAEKRAPAKRRRGEVLSDPEKGEGKTEKESTNATRRRQSRSSSSDSDPCGTRKERLTRSSQSWQEKEGDGEGNRRRRRPARSSEWGGRTVSNNTGTGESGSETSSVRVTRKSSGPLPTSESKPQSNSVPSTPPQPEVLGKRCSALNAAAKLLAMRGRVDTPGSRKDPAAKAAGQNVISPASSDKNHKSKSKSAPATPQTNCNNKAGISKMTPTKSSRTAARSTRQCPGALVPPLETDNKRGSKKEESEKEKKKPSEEKEEGGERETRSSRGHSACSSVSSDGGGSSRSSSNSSQRTHSLSSQSTGPRLNSSRAPSSSSERERSTERGRRRSHRKEGEGWGRETRKERKERHAQKRERLSQEGNAGSGEGTPDRVLRSVAAMAAAQARTPAANTRSSRSSSAQHNKT